MGVPYFEGTYREIYAQEQNWLNSTWALHLVPPSAWDREYLTRLPDFTFNDLQHQWNSSVSSKDEAISSWDRSRASAIYRHKLGLTPASGFGERLAAKDVTLTNFDFIQYINSFPILNNPDLETVAKHRESILAPLLYGGVNSIVSNAESDPYSWAFFAYQDNTDKVEYSKLYSLLTPFDKAVLDEYQRRKREGESYWSGSNFLNTRAAQDFAKGFIIVAGAVIGGAVVSGVAAPTGGAVAAGGAATGSGAATSGTIAGGSAATAGAATGSGTLAGSTGLLSGAGAASTGGATSAGVLTSAGLGTGAAATTGVTLATAAEGGGIVSALWAGAQSYAQEAGQAYIAKELATQLQPKKQPTSSSQPSAGAEIFTQDSKAKLAWVGVVAGLFLLIKKT